MAVSFKTRRAFLERVPFESDLLDYLTHFCRRHRIRCAAVNVIGATSEATIGYYDQVEHDYAKKVFREEMEIVSCSGNVSVKDGAPFLHLHAVLGDTKLRTFGGHLFPGSKVFAAEAYIQELAGPGRTRLPDRVTGLTLWA